MLQEGILNPQLNDLLSRIRHTNTLVIADWAFPYWNNVEIVDLSLTRGIPLITDLLDLLKVNFKVGQIWQAEEFLSTNPAEVITQYNESFDGFKGLSPGSRSPVSLTTTSRNWSPMPLDWSAPATRPPTAISFSNQFNRLFLS